MSNFLLIHQPEERPRHFKFPSKLNAIQSFSDIDIGNGDWSNLVCIVDRILYARKGEDVTSQAVNLGGDKISVEEAIVSRGETFVSWHSHLVGSDKYLVFNLHQHPSHTAHVQLWQVYYIEPIRGEMESVSANNK